MACHLGLGASELEFQSQLSNEQLKYYKKLLPENLSISEDCKESQFVCDPAAITSNNALKIAVSTQTHDPNPTRHSQDAYNQQNVRATMASLPTHSMQKRNDSSSASPITPEPEPNCRNEFDLKQNNQFSTDLPQPRSSKHKHDDCKDETDYDRLIQIHFEIEDCDHDKCWQIDLNQYAKKHTKREYIAEFHEFQDNLNMFKLDLNHNIGALMKVIIPKVLTLHSSGYVHLGIEPANICMDFATICVKNGQCDMYYHEPLRFGMKQPMICCKESTRLMNIPSHTHLSANIGYNAPEILTKNKANVFVTKAFDVWCLGITILHLIEGAHPFLDDLVLQFEAEIIDNVSLESVLSQSYMDEFVRYNGKLIKLENQMLKDLLLNMLRVNVDERYSVQDIINHKWYQQYCV